MNVEESRDHSVKFECRNLVKVRWLFDGWLSNDVKEINNWDRRDSQRLNGRWDLEQRTSQFKHGYFITNMQEYLKFKLKVNNINTWSSSLASLIPLLPFSVSSGPTSSSASSSSSPRATATSTMVSLSLEIHKRLNIFNFHLHVCSLARFHYF